MKKKFLVVLLAAVLGSTLISGCGSDPSKAESGQKKKESAWLNSDIYTKQYTFDGTIGEIITNTPVPARALFV